MALSCSLMGRELKRADMDKKPNGVAVKSNGVFNDRVHVAPKISGDSIEAKDYEEKECTTEDSVVENSNEKQDVLGVKSTNFDADLSEGKNEKPGAQKSSDDDISSSPISKSGGAGNARAHQTVSQPFALATEKRAGVHSSANANNMQSPISTKNSQVIEILNGVCDECRCPAFILYV